MADKRCFVQFPHPGDEHKPDGDGKIGWNKTHRWNKTRRKYSANPHKRKFMQFCGEWIDKDDDKHCSDLRAWGEWEPESECMLEFHSTVGGPHHPNYLWKPYWIPRNTYRCLHNTDPFIFGDRFLYSNCGQLPRSKRGLKHLDVGSVIAFGSKVKREPKWALDTVLVVRDSLPYDPLDPRKALEGKVPEAFLNVTGGPLTEDPKLKELADEGKAPEFRLYRGATPNDPVDGMFSFFPAIPADSESCFSRPVVTLDDKFFTANNFRVPKGTRHCRKSDELRCIWDSLVAQVRRDDLVLGTRAEMPAPSSQFR